MIFIEEKVDDFDQILSDGTGFGFGNEFIYRKQQELDVVCNKTLFTKQEIKILYWGWKVACPEGLLNEYIFKEIYGQFFPQAGKHTGFCLIDACFIQINY